MNLTDEEKYHVTYLLLRDLLRKTDADLTQAYASGERALADSLHEIISSLTQHAIKINTDLHDDFLAWLQSGSTEPMHRFVLHWLDERVP